MAGICLANPTLGRAGSPALPGNTPVPFAVQSKALPLSFEANQGQVDPRVKYLARGQGYTLFLTSNETVLGLRAAGADKSTQWLRLLLQGAVTDPAITAEDPLAGHSNYFIGNDRSKWQTKIPTYARLRYQQVYPGVDLIYYGRQGNLENDFEVAPGTNPKVISWRTEGAEKARIDDTGNLILMVGDDQVRLQQPRAYQLQGERQVEIPVRYKVHGEKISFALGKYDRRQKLIIDPVLTYSTYLGGSGGDTAYGVALDSTGDVYVAGVTASTNFPVSSSTFQSTYAGDGDVFIAEFNPAGTGLIFSTFLGGTGNDTPAEILLSSFGNLFIVGSTTSNNFPITSGVLQQNYAGNQDAFLTEMKPDGFRPGLLHLHWRHGRGLWYDDGD